MNMSQSKLMIQLNKQQKITEKITFSEEKIEELYGMICKLQPKNLMLIQFLTLIIQKNLVKNSFKIQTFVDMYEEIKGKKLQQQHNSFTLMNKIPVSTTYSNMSANNNNPSNTNINISNSSNNNTQVIQKEEQKFNKKKFLKLLKDLAKMLYPGDPKAYEVTLYLKLVMPEQQENRMKVDDNLKKFLNNEVIQALSSYQKELQTLFQIYMPQNYNFKLGFEWNEIRLLEKRLPIMCLLRILFEAQISPQNFSQTQFLQVMSKMIPPLNSNHKEVMFYYNETFNSYMREHIFSDQIKLLEGDAGLTFFQFQMVLVRIASQLSKENKQQYVKYLDKFMTQLNLTQIIKNKKESLKMTKLQSIVLNHFKQADKVSPQSNQNSKKLFRKENLLKKQHQQLNSLIDEPQVPASLKTAKVLQENLPLRKLQHQSMLVTKQDLFKIKRILDDQLGPAPQKALVDKENEGYFNVNEKFVVIGDQLPKLQQKNKPVSKPNPKQKKEDSLLGYKLQEQAKSQSVKPTPLLSRKKKLRINTEYPIILGEVFYPASFSQNSTIQLKQEQQVFLQTAYIHLGERMYEEAFLNFQKAKKLIKEKKPIQIGQSDKKQAILLQFYFQVLEAQIFQAAGKDQAALAHYFNAREIGFNLPNSESKAKAFTFMGLSSALYHLEQYQFSLRCMLKAKQIYGDLEIQSVDNAILLNNIGSCYMMLNRNQEAVKFFNLSHQILDLKVGRFDERTLVIQQNISKNKKAFIEQMPSFKTMWKTYVQKNTTLTAVKVSKKTTK